MLSLPSSFNKVKAKQHILLLIGAVFLSITHCFSTHIVGGVLTYRALPNNDYEVSLTVYRDCYNGVPFFSNPALIIAFDSSHNAVDTLVLPIDSIRNIPTPAIYQNACRYKLPHICYHYATYTGIIHLPYSPGGYTLAYEQCCWNWTIHNIDYGGNLVMKTEITDSAMINGNQAPLFKDLPPSIVCQGLPFNFDHSANDADGDSLVYELFTPFEGIAPPFGPVPYQAGYSLTNLTNSVNDMKIDSVTGMLSVTIDALGQYVYGVRVKEYRNGTYIGSTWRTYQINSASCDTVGIKVDYSVAQIPCETNKMEIRIDSSNADLFLWKFGSSPFTAGPVYSFIAPDTGTYPFTLIAIIDSLDCRDTLYENIRLDTILPEDSITAGFEISDIYCTNAVTFNNTTINGTTFSWDFGDLSAIDTTVHPVHTFPDTGLYTIRLLGITGRDKCRDSIQRQVRILEKLELDPSFTRRPCSNELSLLANIPPELRGDYDLFWDFGDSGSDTALNPVYVYQEPGLYQIQLKAIFKGDHYGCGDTSYLQYEAQEITYPEFTVSASQQRIFGSSGNISLQVVPASYSRYQWTPANLVSNPRIPDPKTHPQKTTTYVVTVVNAVGCAAVDSITIEVGASRCGESELFVPNAFTPNNDGENDFLRVRGGEIRELHLAVYNRWGELVFESTDAGMTTDPSKGWNGTYRGEELSPDVYIYYLRALCYEGEEFIKKGNVTLIR